METLRLIYEEQKSELALQLDRVDSLNDRATQSLALSAILLTIVATFAPVEREGWVRVCLVLLVCGFAITAWICWDARRLRYWRGDPKSGPLWNEYRLETEEHIRHQVIQNRRDAIAQNEKTIGDKLDRLKCADRWLGGSLAAVTLVLVLRLMT